MQEVAGEQGLQQRLALGRAAELAGPLPQAVGIGGVRHAGDLAKVQLYADAGRRLSHLGLTQAHPLLAAKAPQIEIVKRLPLHRQRGQQLHPAPAHGNLHLGLRHPQLGQRLIQLTLADETPGTDEIEIDLDAERHALTSLPWGPVVTRRASPSSLATSLW